MTHTIRQYNKWAKMPWHPYSTEIYSHPWKQFCMGNCVCCKDDEKYRSLSRKRNKILLKKHKFERV